jgi:hypothetical protein
MKCFIICLFVFYSGFMAIEAQLAGGIVDADPNDPQFKNVLEFCEKMLDNAVNSVFSHKVGKVIKAQTQVVSGLKYYLTFEFSETSCLKNRSPNEVVQCDITVSNSNFIYSHFIHINMCFINRKPKYVRLRFGLVHGLRPKKCKSYLSIAKLNLNLLFANFLLLLY